MEKKKGGEGTNPLGQKGGELGERKKKKRECRAHRHVSSIPRVEGKRSEDQTHRQVRKGEPLSEKKKREPSTHTPFTWSRRGKKEKPATTLAWESRGGESSPSLWGGKGEERPTAIGRKGKRKERKTAASSALTEEGREKGKRVVPPERKRGGMALAVFPEGGEKKKEGTVDLSSRKP